MKAQNKTLAAVLGGAFAASLAVSPVVHADQNPFAMKSLSGGYQVADADTKMKDGKCGTGKCGANKKKAEKEGSCSSEKGKEGSCHADKSKEGSCSSDKGKEGSCHADKK